MQVIHLFWWACCAMSLLALTLVGGCAATGELPVCTSQCTLNKSWGL